jgi:DNA-binding CsgD family transcriptional regulator
MNNTVENALYAVEQMKPLDDTFSSTKSQTALTQQEIRLLKLVCQGLSNIEIGEKLFISIHTVKRHKANIMSKLKIKGQLDFRKFLLQISKNGTLESQK